MDVVNVTEDADVFTSNAHLLTGERTALVDAGAMPGVVDAIRRHVDDLDAVALTHQHGDHVGELDAVLDAFDADLYARDDHPRRTAALADGDEITLGDESFEAVDTPGHAPDHLAFVGETALFSGDVVVYSDGAFDDGSFGRTDRPGRSRDRLIESLDTLLDRLPPTVERMYAGHGPPFHATEASDTVADVIARARERAARHEPKYPDE